MNSGWLRTILRRSLRVIVLLFLTLTSTWSLLLAGISNANAFPSDPLPPYKPQSLTIPDYYGHLADSFTSAVIDPVGGYAFFGANGTVAKNPYYVNGTNSRSLACFLSPTSITGSGTAALSCTGSVAGNFLATVAGVSGSLVHSAAVSVTVTSFVTSFTSDFAFSPSSPAVGQTVTFSGSASGGTAPYTFFWTFGDGTTGTGSLVTHAYSASGDYTVVFTVTDLFGVGASSSHSVTVGGSGADFSLSASPPSLSFFPGGSATSMIAVAPVNNFIGTVSLTIAITTNNPPKYVPFGGGSYVGVVRLSDFTERGAWPVPYGPLTSAVIDDTPPCHAYFGTDTMPGYIVKFDCSNFTQELLQLAAGEGYLTSAVRDPAGKYAYFGTSTNPGRIVRIDLSTFQEAGSLTLPIPTDPCAVSYLTSGVIDPAGKFAYFGGFRYSDGQGMVVRVDLSAVDFSTSTTTCITLNSGEDNLDSALIDPVLPIAYFGAENFIDTSPSIIVRLDLSTFTEVSHLTLDSATVKADTNKVVSSGVVGRLTSAVMYPSGGFAAFGTDGSPGQVVLIRLSPINNPNSPFDQWSMQYLHVLTLPPSSATGLGENSLASAVIDSSGDYAYFGTFTSPGNVVKVPLGAGTSQDPAPPANELCVYASAPSTVFNFNFNAPYFGHVWVQLLQKGNALSKYQVYGLNPSLAGPFGNKPGIIEDDSRHVSPSLPSWDYKICWGDPTAQYPVIITDLAYKAVMFFINSAIQNPPVYNVLDQMTINGITVEPYHNCVDWANDVVQELSFFISQSLTLPNYKLTMVIPVSFPPYLLVFSASDPWALDLSLANGDNDGGKATVQSNPSPFFFPFGGPDPPLGSVYPGDSVSAITRAMLRNGTAVALSYHLIYAQNSSLPTVRVGVNQTLIVNLKGGDINETSHIYNGLTINDWGDGTNTTFVSSMGHRYNATGVYAANLAIMNNSTLLEYPYTVNVTSTPQPPVQVNATTPVNGANTFDWTPTSTLAMPGRPITKASPTITTTLSPPSPVSAGTSVTDSATLSGASTNAGGTVTYKFFTGSTCAGTAVTVGTPVAVTNRVVPNSAPQTFNSVGSYSWNAVYSGDAFNNGATSACETLTATDFSISATSACSSGPNCSPFATIILSAFNGFSGTVTLTDIVPSGLSCGPITPSSVRLPPPPQQATATLTCSSSTAGDYTVAVTATSGALVHSANATFTCSGARCSSVGGEIVPVDKLGLLAHFIGLAFLIVAATAGTVVFVRRVKHGGRQAVDNTRSKSSKT